MIKKLTCSVTFASSGFTLDATFQPQTGITTVVGPNGVGKTFSTIELTRYLLFGKKALRGPASGYKNLDATGIFVIRGEEYTIHRGAKEETIKNAAGEIEAVNATAVTEKVTELMGYGLDVFDVCNASVQGDTHLFSKLPPAERKRMLDRVVGLSSNETIEKACRAEAAALKREVDALVNTLVVPVSPTASFSGTFSDEIVQKLENGREYRRSYDRLASKLLTLTKPVKPEVQMPASIDVAMIEKLQDDYRDTERQRTRLKSQLQNVRPFSEYTSEQLDAAEARARKRKLIDAAGPKPTLASETIERGWQEWALFDAHTDSDDVTCPKCSHMFKPTGETPMVTHSKEKLRDEAKRISAWVNLNNDLPDGPDLTLKQIRHGRAAIEASKAAREAQEELDALPAITDRSEQLATLREAQAAWNAYLHQHDLYERGLEVNSKIHSELAELGDPLSDEELDALAEQLSQARLFEAQWSAYDKAKIAYDKTLAEIEDKRKLSEEFKEGGKALAETRAAMKAFLAPALSRTASSLLYDMTNGKLASVTIDDDMNILVGSQTLETLSGGGLTAANIALRIALGQVLVADTFPVFLGDEIDADIDPVRREAVIEALVGLKDHLDQIILVTHRDLSVADHVYDLGNTG